MRKNIFISSMSAELGGIEKSLIEILRFLDKKGYDIDLLLWKQHGELLKYIPDNVNIIESPSPGSFIQCVKGKKAVQIIRYIKLKLYTVFLKAPWKSFKKQKNAYEIAISFTQDGYSPPYVIDNVKAKKKLLWYHHGSYTSCGKQKKKDTKYFSKYDTIVTVSEANKKMLLNHFPDLESKIKVISNLVDIDRIESQSKEKCSAFDGYNGCKLVTVGRIAKEKGQLFALDVASEMKKSGFDFQWCFVGDGPEMYKCIEKVKYLDLEESCFFVGAKENPYSYMNMADVYVQPSFVESEAITIKEAMILKKRIIASNIPAIKETIGNYSNGVICDLNTNDFKRNITEQKDCITDVENKYELEITIQKLNDLFE